MASPSPDSSSHPAGAVFLSYAREDGAAAQRIADALRAFGVEVWFDQSELRGGDTWDQKIRGQIKTCALFMPIISATTQARGEGYFRREWLLAAERTRDMASGVAFIVPVVTDDTAEGDASVPEEFMRFQWTRLAHGVPTPQFVEHIKRTLESPRKAAPVVARVSRPVGSENTGQETRATSEPVGRRVTAAAWVIAIAAIAVLAGIFFSRQHVSPPNAGAGTRPPTVEKAASAIAEKSTAAEKSVAVLAFTDLSEKRDSEYFSDGISEDLLDALAKVPGLRVAARTSAFSFKGRNAPIPEIAQKLNVAYVVEGSVQRDGANVRITAQLIKAADGFHVWSEHFDRELKNVFAVQDEIAGLIAKQLSLSLGASSAAATAAVNPQAFEFYVRAQEGWNLRTAEGFARAEVLLNQALALEPNFARAHAALGTVSVQIATTTGKLGLFGQRNGPLAADVRRHIDRALALDPNLAEAHAALGGFLWEIWRTEDAVRELRLAISLNPNYATAHQWLGRALLSDGRIEESAAALRRATELDPLSHRIWDNYSYPLIMMNRPAEALAADDRALALQPDSVQALVWKASALSALGRDDEAVALLRRLTLANTVYQQYAIRVFVHAGLRAEAEQVYASMATGSNARSKYFSLATLGRLEEALAAMDADSIHAQPWGEVLVSADFDPIRHDPRFVTLLATLGMTEAHARAQAWRAAHPASNSAKP